MCDPRMNLLKKLGCATRALVHGVPFAPVEHSSFRFGGSSAGLIVAGLTVVTTRSIAHPARGVGLFFP